MTLATTNPGSGEGARWARMCTHLIITDRLAEFGASWKLNAERAFLTMLKEEGRRCGEAFLLEQSGALGKRSTADIDVLLAEV